ncbi:hypothetical protein CDN99_02370 [Roseateles aquatilis]|uniref:DUF3619 domain-containing protein n=1 Tax=Roseateles aquatilis TaxID=431061 RepID=A0A246JL23_9BURK|nr:DUF3619 family protein [Roseateles aquatilis]OWQ93346.1 hypothetical protein CDN99_02370 [Roseateles aquatilis]
MKKNTPGTPLPQELDARVTRFGLRVAAGLTENSTTLSGDIQERLRFAREQALAKAIAARAAAPVTESAVRHVGGGTLALGGGDKTPRWLKAAALLPLALLLGGLLLIQHSQWYEQIRSAAELDTEMLSKPLPPAAYSDPGFREYLNEHPNDPNSADDAKSDEAKE